MHATQLAAAPGAQESDEMVERLGGRQESERAQREVLETSQSQRLRLSRHFYTRYARAKAEGEKQKCVVAKVNLKDVTPQCTKSEAACTGNLTRRGRRLGEVRARTPYVTIFPYKNCPARVCAPYEQIPGDIKVRAWGFSLLVRVPVP